MTDLRLLVIFGAYPAYLMSEGRQCPQMSASEHLLSRWDIYCPETYLVLTCRTLGLTIVPGGLTVVPLGLTSTPRGFWARFYHDVHQLLPLPLPLPLPL